MKSKEELTKIYNELNESEKYGIHFGLFPVKYGIHFGLFPLKLRGLTKDEIVGLIEIGKVKNSNLTKYEKGKTIGRNQQKKAELIFKNAKNVKYYTLNNNFSGESPSYAFNAPLYMWQTWSDLKFAKLIEYENNNYELYLHSNAWYKFESIIN